MTTPQDNGGPAFPPHLHGEGYGSMTLRDYFAAAALQGLLASGHFTKPAMNEQSLDFKAMTFDELDNSMADEDRPVESHWYESKECRRSYDDEATKGKTTIDCVESAMRIADAMLAARNAER